MPTRYMAACIQSNIRVVNEADPGRDVEGTIRANLRRAMELVDYLMLDGRYGGPKLVVFSEFCLTGVPESRKLADYLERAVPIPGWVTETVGQKARQYGLHICMNTFERDPDWPGRVFNTSFIVDPNGDVILRYRKNNNSQSGIPKNTNPGDIYSAYVARYGSPEALFPVVDTELGRLACMTCVDLRFAEVARCLALNGAEVILHPTAEPSATHLSPWQMSKQVRAWENSVYLLSCNNGRTLGSFRPEDRQCGGSRIIDYQGRILAEAGQGETVITAPIDLDALRRHRATVRGDVIAQSRFATYLPIYQKAQTWPIDRYIDEPLQDDAQARAIQAEVRARMYESGRWVPPRGA